MKNYRVVFDSFIFLGLVHNGELLIFYSVDEFLSCDH